MVTRRHISGFKMYYSNVAKCNFVHIDTMCEVYIFMEWTWGYENRIQGTNVR